MSARDELAGIIGDYHVWSGEEGCGGKEKAADAILAAGYSKPRTITTAEELDAMGWKATVLDANECVWVNDGDTLDEWASLGERDPQGGPIWRGSADIALPATVLHEATR